MRQHAPCISDTGKDNLGLGGRNIHFIQRMMYFVTSQERQKSFTILLIKQGTNSNSFYIQPNLYTITGVICNYIMHKWGSLQTGMLYSSYFEVISKASVYLVSGLLFYWSNSCQGNGCLNIYVNLWIFIWRVIYFLYVNI